MVKISVEGKILPGCISTAMGKCGTKNCRCKANPPMLHGPYYRWTGLINGKATTITLSKEEAQECEKRIKNYRRLQQQLDRALKGALDKAPWNCRD